MDEKLYKKGLQCAVAANELSSDFDTRIEAFKQDCLKALNTKQENERLFLFRRLRDELNGYFIRIYAVVLSGTTAYKKEKKRTKHLKKIKAIFEDDISVLEEAITKLKHSRDCSAHPIAYQLNLELFHQEDFIKKVLLKIEEKLTLLFNLEKDMILVEKRRQERRLEGTFNSLKSNINSKAREAN